MILLGLFHIAACGWLETSDAIPRRADPCQPWRGGLYTLPMDAFDRPDPWIYLPQGGGPRDMVVALHGNNHTALEFADATRFDALADRDGFIVVLPQGIGGERTGWNAGPTCCGEANASGSDDVAYLDAVVTQARRMTCATGRVLAVGFSNGGMMLHRWACEGASPPDAIAAAAAPAMNDWSACRAGPVPVHLVHGALDERIPLAGGRGDRGVNEFRSLDASISEWKKRNRCAEEPREAIHGDTRCTSWTCEASTISCVVDGHGHAWPGGRNVHGSNVRMTERVWSWFDTMLTPHGAAR